MEEIDRLQVQLQPYNEKTLLQEYDLDSIIYDLDSQIKSFSNQPDKFDYLLSISSGIICGSLDILWVGSFNLENGRSVASNEIDKIVTKTAKLVGYKGDELKGAVRFLEKSFPIPSDGNTPEFGGGLQHHLRDFAHHPTIVGLIFSLLTQFTNKSYGTDTNGNFLIVEIPEASKNFIGHDIPTKIIHGTITWFFHLVSDVAGSSSSVGRSGGTGIPGPLLGLAKEISVLPFFKNIKVGDKSLSVFLSKLFNGTLLAKHDESGKIIKDSVLKFDLRGELGVGIELGRQAIPVIANECIVRSFYFIRNLVSETIEHDILSFKEMKEIQWNNIMPLNNPTISRMLTIATGVFTTLDVGEAIISKKYLVNINYIGIGRFSVAIGEDISWCLKGRNIKNIKRMYEDIQRFTYTYTDDKIYERMENDMNVDKLGLTVEQIEILYNLEYQKILNDVRNTKLHINNDSIKLLKHAWISEWKRYITKGFSGFIQSKDAEIHWYTEQELKKKIEDNKPYNTWFRLVLLEAILFDPYYPLSTEKDKKGNEIPSKKYSKLQLPFNRYSKDNGDEFLESYFLDKSYYTKGYIKRLRKSYNSAIREMIIKGVLKGVIITAGITIVTIATAGALAPSIAVFLVGSNFAGLSGAALTSASLAYLGGGAVAVGGLGMAGGTMAIVGGGAVLGIGAGLSAGGVTITLGTIGKENTTRQSAKLLVSVKEIFLNDEHDIEYSNIIYEQYVQNIIAIEKGLVELKLQADVANHEENKELKKQIKNAEETVQAMKIARKNLLKFKSSFEEGLNYSDNEIN